MSARAPARESPLAAGDRERLVALIGREPTALEEDLCAALWSEHCSYRSSRALLRRLPSEGQAVRTGAGENAGVVEIGDGWAVALKVESHNHPSAVEPYQGAATGVGGIIRDILAMGATPVALLNALHFGPPRSAGDRRTVREVVRGIAGYGNAVGVPTVGGETRFDPACAGNPLVNVMAVGLLPPGVRLGSAAGPSSREERVFLLYGARTGRDGLGGAAFASVDLGEDRGTRRPQVQVGDPFTGRRLIDATVELVASGRIVALQDLGAAGLASALVEMAFSGSAGAVVDLGGVPLREPGLEPAAVLLSESQERMLALVRSSELAAVQDVLSRHGLAAGVVGRPTDDGHIVVTARGQVLAHIPARVLARGAPEAAPPGRGAAIAPSPGEDVDPLQLREVPARIEALLATPDLGSRLAIHRQFDSRVQSRTVAGPGGDAALLLAPDGRSALALTLVSSRHGDLDPYRSAVGAVAAAARRIRVTGAVPLAATDGLNLGNPARAAVQEQLAATVEGIRDACLALDIPVVSGNVSLYNEHPGGAVDPVAVIGMVGRLEDVDRRAGAGFRRAGDAVVLLGRRAPQLFASRYEAVFHRRRGPAPAVDLDHERRLGALVHRLAAQGRLGSAHAVGEGGLLTALVECLPAHLGARIRLPAGRLDATLFGEEEGQVLVSLDPRRVPELRARCQASSVPWVELGEVVAGSELELATAADRLVLDLDRLHRVRATSLAGVLA